ncbi:MAG: purine-nucleoside phosphorylase [Planctomycetes bacterium]|nr:purine-nucleoside phosphorylase [Planctomycetota bacterium]
MTDSDPILDAAIASLERAGFKRGYAQYALILGSGFGGIEERCESKARIAYEEVPGFARPTGTPGHVCRFTQGRLFGRNLLVFRGRYHAYEGFGPRELVFPVRVAHALGATTLIATNAAGGIREDLTPGALMAISDHLNLLGVNPLVGRQRMSGAAAFAPMAGAYDPALLDQLLAAAKKAGEPMSRGIYAAVLGPSFETEAEVRMLKSLGADAVGMSTVPEVICAMALGMKVAAFSLITNRAGSRDESHAANLAKGEQTVARIGRVLESLLG